MKYIKMGIVLVTMKLEMTKQERGLCITIAIVTALIFIFKYIIL